MVKKIARVTATTLMVGKDELGVSDLSDYTKLLLKALQVEFFEGKDGIFLWIPTQPTLEEFEGAGVSQSFLDVIKEMRENRYLFLFVETI